MEVEDLHVLSKGRWARCRVVRCPGFYDVARGGSQSTRMAGGYVRPVGTWFLDTELERDAHWKPRDPGDAARCTPLGEPGPLADVSAQERRGSGVFYAAQARLDFE